MIQHRADTIITRLRARQSYLSTVEVMELLLVSRQTLCGWVRAGTIPATRVGSGNVFDPLALASRLEARNN
jgi:excisionase family DNA binding protein